MYMSHVIQYRGRDLRKPLAEYWCREHPQVERLKLVYIHDAVRPDYSIAPPEFIEILQHHCAR